MLCFFGFSSDKVTIIVVSEIIVDVQESDVDRAWRLVLGGPWQNNANKPSGDEQFKGNGDE